MVEMPYLEVEFKGGNSEYAKNGIPEIVVSLISLYSDYMGITPKGWSSARTLKFDLNGLHEDIEKLAEDLYSIKEISEVRVIYPRKE